MSVRGNHDDLALQYYSTPDSRPKKGKWVAELTEEEAQFLAGLPLGISIPDHNVVVVHAGLVPGIPLEQQSHETITTMRNLHKEVSNC